MKNFPGSFCAGGIAASGKAVSRGLNKPPADFEVEVACSGTLDAPAKYSKVPCFLRLGFSPLAVLESLDGAALSGRRRVCVD